MPEKQELIERIMNVEYIPNLELKTYDVDTTTAFPIKNLGSIGSAAKPISDMIGRFASTGKSGFYYVETGGKQMFKHNGKFIGSLAAKSGGVGGGQAVMTPISIDIASLATTCAIMAIENKINQITEAQKDIANFLLFKEQAKIKANINSLLEVLNDYKYNANNEKYKNNKHILVQSIKNESEQSVLLMESIIEDKTKKKIGIHFEKKTDEYLKESIDRLNDFQLGIYQYAFSSFLEIMLLENFDANYMDSVTKKIVEHKEKYKLLSTTIKEKAKSLSESSIQNGFKEKEAKLLSNTGKFLSKISSNKYGEKMQLKGSEIDNNRSDSINKKLELLSDVNSNLTEPFEKTIDMVKMIYSNQYNIAFDNENIYLSFDN